MYFVKIKSVLIQKWSITHHQISTLNAYSWLSKHGLARLQNVNLVRKFPQISHIHWLYGCHLCLQISWLMDKEDIFWWHINTCSVVPESKISSVQFSHSVVFDSLCTPGSPVHHQLPELAQTHVHRVVDAIQPSHPLSSPSSPAFNLSQHQRLF